MTRMIFDGVCVFYVSYVHTFPLLLRPWPFHLPHKGSPLDFFLCTDLLELLDRRLVVDEYFLVDNRDLALDSPVVGRSPLVDHYAVDTSHQTVVDMRHLVVLVEDMHRFVLGMLTHRMDNHLLVDRSADKLHWTVDIPVLDSGTPVFDWDIPEPADN